MSERPNAWAIARQFLGLTPDARFLTIGSVPMEWSSTGNQRGYIYMNHPLLNSVPLWELAPSPCQRLADVRAADMLIEFYGMNDPRGSNVFGSNWAGHALCLPEGQILFARLVTNQSAVYAIHLARQGTGKSRGRLWVDYVSVTSQRERK